MNKPKPLAKPKTMPCPDCGGRGTVAFGPDDVTCAACAGKGTVTDARDAAK